MQIACSMDRASGAVSSFFKCSVWILPKKKKKSAMYGQLPIQKTTKMQTVKLQCMVLHSFVIYTDKWYLLINFDLWWFLFPRFCIDLFFYLFEEYFFWRVWLFALTLMSTIAGFPFSDSQLSLNMFTVAKPLFKNKFWLDLTQPS